MTPDEQMIHFCASMRKPDWETLQKRLQDNEVRIEDGPVQRWGAHGTGTFVYFMAGFDNRTLDARPDP